MCLCETERERRREGNKSRVGHRGRMPLMRAIDFPFLSESQHIFYSQKNNRIIFDGVVVHSRDLGHLVVIKLDLDCFKGVFFLSWFCYDQIKCVLYQHKSLVCD